jgi:hypothetical protein
MAASPKSPASLDALRVDLHLKTPLKQKLSSTIGVPQDTWMALRGSRVDAVFQCLQSQRHWPYPLHMILKEEINPLVGQGQGQGQGTPSQVDRLHVERLKVLG